MSFSAGTYDGAAVVPTGLEGNTPDLITSTGLTVLLSASILFAAPLLTDTMIPSKPLMLRNLRIRQGFLYL